MYTYHNNHKLESSSLSIVSGLFLSLTKSGIGNQFNVRLMLVYISVSVFFLQQNGYSRIPLEWRGTGLDRSYEGTLVLNRKSAAALLTDLN